jgi:hypothetical protein
MSADADVISLDELALMMIQGGRSAPAKTTGQGMPTKAEIDAMLGGDPHEFGWGTCAIAMGQHCAAMCAPEAKALLERVRDALPSSAPARGGNRAPAKRRGR